MRAETSWREGEPSEKLKVVEPETKEEQEKASKSVKRVRLDTSLREGELEEKRPHKGILKQPKTSTSKETEVQPSTPPTRQEGKHQTRSYQR